MSKIYTIILAGGRSTRFGSPKPFLKFDGKLTFLEKLVDVYNEFGCENIVTVLNQSYYELFVRLYPESFRSKMNLVYNSKSELGRFYSLTLGSSLVSDADYCFIQNIDNPFTDLVTLRKLYNSRRDDSYISPVNQNKGGHPILIPKLIIDKINKETDKDLNTKVFLNQFSKITVEVLNEKIFANINSHEDYADYFKTNN